MKRIVIPTDFSEAAWHATEYGLKLAAKTNIDVLVIHCFDMPHAGAGNMVSIIDIIEEDAKKDMDILRKKIEGANYTSGIEITYRCVQGDLTEVLRKYVATDGNEIIVMGTQGATGIRRMVTGSNASKVIKKLDAPVLAIPPHSEYGFENGIACGIDENTTLRSSDSFWLETLLSLTPTKQLALVNILDEEEMSAESLTKVPDNFDHLDVELVELLNSNVVEGLDEYVNSSNTDCLILIRRNLNFFEKLFKFSVSRDVATIIQTPLLVLRAAL